MRQTVIFSLYNKGHIEDITNWRPISLLNYHKDIYIYIYTKILANKIQLTLEDTIGLEQTPAVKQKTITEKLQLNREVMSYANANN